MVEQLTSIRILYVEDNDALASLLKRNLERHGYAVDVIGDGSAGVRMLVEGSYHIALVDNKLPGMSGIDIIKETNSKSVDTPVIMLTGHGNEKIVVEAMHQGAADYIIKDVELDYLKLLPAVIEKALQKQFLVREKIKKDRALNQRLAVQKLVSSVSTRFLTAKFEEFDEAVWALLQSVQSHFHFRQCYVFLLQESGTVLGKGYILLPDGSHATDESGLEETAMATEYWKCCIGRVEPMVIEQLDQLPERLVKMGTKSLVFIPMTVAGVLVGVLSVETSREYTGCTQDDMDCLNMLGNVLANSCERQRLDKKLRYQAAKDSLTGTNNRRNFFELAKNELKRAERRELQVFVLMIDLDDFKVVNDTYGHHAGDETLKAVVQVVSAHLRPADVMGRLGGEEFAILANECTQTVALEMGERIRQVISELTIEIPEGTLRVTASIGIAEVNPLDTGLRDALRNADRALYSAKIGGRNRIELLPTPEASQK